MDPNHHNLLNPVALIMDDDDEDDTISEVDAAALLLVSVVLDARLRRQEQRAEHRLYLTRPDLAQHPRMGTPWHALHQSLNDRAYITTMGVNVTTFNYLLEEGFQHIWDTTPIPREDVSGHTAPRLWRRSLDAAGALGLCLHYLNSTMSEFTLQQLFSLVPSTVTRYLTFGLHLLLTILRKIPEAQIRWPRAVDEYQYLSSAIQERHPLLRGAFGFIDGLNLPVQAHGDDTIENATYNGWLHSHYVSNVLVFSPEGKITLIYMLYC